MTSSPASQRARLRWGVDEPCVTLCPEAGLVELLKESNVFAFELIYELHAPAALGLARRICRDATVAENATQDAFLAVWRECHRYRPDRGSVRSWVLAVTRARAIDRLRTMSTHTELTHGQVVELAYLGGLTVSEIAQAQGVPVSTVKRRMRLGLNRLRGGTAAELGAWPERAG